MEEIKKMLSAVLDRLDVMSADLEAVKNRLNRMDGRMAGIEHSLDYLAKKTGQHEKDIYILRQQYFREEAETDA